MVYCFLLINMHSVGRLGREGDWVGGGRQAVHYMAIQRDCGACRHAFVQLIKEGYNNVIQCHDMPGHATWQSSGATGTLTRKIGSKIEVQIWHSPRHLGKRLIDLGPQRS